MNLARLWRVGLVGVLLVLAGPAPSAHAQAEAPANLLAGARVVSSVGVRAPERIVDGQVPPEGDPWKSERTASLGPRAFVIFDLGRSTPVGAAWLQGDNNDHYRVELSEVADRDFRLLWEGRPVSSGGLRARRGENLSGQGRYVRLSASEGDKQYAVGELQLFAGRKVVEPARLRPRRPPGARFNDGLILWAMGLLGALLLATPRAPRWLNRAAAGLGAVAAVPLALAWWDSPPEPATVTGLRLLTAGLVVAALLREQLPVFGRAAHPRAVTGALVVAGLLGPVCFYNGLQPQFHDAKAGEKTFVHLLDLRQYHATARFYRELGYSGLYDADLAALLADQPGRVLPDDLVVRDLVTMRSSTYKARRAQVEAAPARFTPERWEAFRADARMMRELMGERDWLRYLLDMGGNASPVWLANAKILFDALPTSMDSFRLLSWLDPILLALMFVAIGRSFGARLAWICLAVFGSTDFIMYTSNWAGAVLRHDWLVLLGLGAAALRAGRPGLGGALLGGSAMLRAFPALALFALLPLVIAWLWGQRRATGRWLPDVATLRGRPEVRALVGAALAAVVLLLYSGAVLGFDAWPAWWVKVRQLTAAPSRNSLGLKAVMFSSMDAAGIAKSGTRRAALHVLQVAFLLLLWAGIRRRTLERAALVGMLALPVLFYPSNYYMHVVCLFPLLAAGAHRAASARFSPLAAALAAVPALVSVLQYPTTLISDVHQHFLMSSWLTCGLVLTLALLAARHERAAAAEHATTAS